MSVSKSELKLALIQELGCSADDDLEAAERDVLRATGRIQAAGALEHQVTKIIAKLDSDMDSDAPPFSDLETQKKAKFYLGACLAACVTARKQGDNLRLQMEGRVMAFKHTIERLQKSSEITQRKRDAVRAIEAALVDPNSDADIDLRSRPVGVHPGPSLSSQRKAEAAVPAGDGVKKKKKKRRKKKKKAAVTKKAPKKKKKKKTPGRKKTTGEADNGASNS